VNIHSQGTTRLNRRIEGHSYLRLQPVLFGLTELGQFGPRYLLADRASKGCPIPHQLPQKLTPPLATEAMAINRGDLTAQVRPHRLGGITQRWGDPRQSEDALVNIGGLRLEVKRIRLQIPAARLRIQA